MGSTPSSSFSKIAILGSGAIGSYYGARLAKAGADVRFLARSDAAVLNEQGIEVQLPDQRLIVHPVNATADPREIGPCDLAIIALKATGNAALANLIPPLLHQHTALLTLENGLGSDELLAAQFGSERVIGGLCFIAASRTSPGKISCVHPGSISLAEFGRPISARVQELVNRFKSAGVNCQASDDLAALRWRKLVWNIPFNGLSIAAGGVTVDRILADPALLTETRTLMAEVIAAAGKLGYSLPESMIDQQISVTYPMGPYKPSSLIDFLAGREVEVEAIWGEP
ncbi:MAG TPA: 2-dehydropantoate 2-reductase, partial [Opitutaceae bacterium]